jgi:DNA-directed RNA polymerase subunit E'/Rpb7
MIFLFSQTTLLIMSANESESIDNGSIDNGSIDNGSIDNGSIDNSNESYENSENSDNNNTPSNPPNNFEYTRRVNVSLILFPSELTLNNMEDVIVEKLVKTYENVCYDNMFIKEILNIIPIDNGKIGSHGEVNYTVQFDAKVLCPQPNDIILGTIQKIITTGLFVQYDVLRCFVKRQCFDSETWNNLKQNHPMKVQLSTFRFQNFHRSISCVGEAF